MTTDTQPAKPAYTQQIVRPFADGDYTFKLTYALAVEWEREHDRSLFATARAAANGHWSGNDVREILRLALIGGGTEPPKALRLVRTYVEDRPLTENVDLFVETLNAFLFGVPVEADAKH